MTQRVRFVDRPGGTVLLDVSPGTYGVQLGEGADFPPPPVRRQVEESPVADGGFIATSPLGLRTVKLPLVYTPGDLPPAGTVRTNLSPAYRDPNGVTQEVRRNTFRNPSANQNLTEWAFAVNAGSTVNVTRKTTGAGSAVPFTTYGRADVTAITTGVVASTGFVLGLPTVDSITVTANEPWQWAAYVRTNVTDRTVQTVVTFHDAAGTQLSPILTGPTVAVGSDGGARWVRVSASIAIAPAGATRAYVRIYGIGGRTWQVGDFMECGGCLSEPIGALLWYFDGDQTDKAATLAEGLTPSWTAAAGASASALTGLRHNASAGPEAYTGTPQIIGWTIPGRNVARVLVKKDAVNATLIGFTNPAPNGYVSPGDFLAGRLKMALLNQVDMAAAVAITPRIVTYTTTPAFVGYTSGLAPNGAGNVALTLGDPPLDVSVPATAEAAVGSSSARYYIQAAGTMRAGTLIEWSEPVIEKVAGVGQEAGPFFDGSSSTGSAFVEAWTGAIYQSSSTQTVLSAADTRRADVQALMRVLNRERVWLEVQPDGAAEARWLHCHRSPDADLNARLAGPMWAELTVTMLADPYALGPKVSLGTFATNPASGLQTIVQGADIKGDAPVPLEVTITAPGNGYRMITWIGSRTTTTPAQTIVEFTSGTAEADAGSLNGSHRRLDVSGGSAQETVTLIGKAGGGSDAALAGTYRIFLLTPYGPSDIYNDPDQFKASLLALLGGWAPGVTATMAERLIDWVQYAAPERLRSQVVDLGLVTAPYGGRPLATDGDADAPLKPMQANVVIEQVTGSQTTYPVDALLVVPADETLLGMVVAPSGAANRDFTLDPYSGQLIAKEAGEVCSDVALTEYVGSPPIATPGEKLTLTAFRYVWDSLGYTFYDASTIGAAITLAYRPRYLSVF